MKVFHNFLILENMRIFESKLQPKLTDPYYQTKN